MGTRVTKTQRFESIGDLLRAVRYERDLTQKDLAALSGLDEQRISRYETGAVEPSFGVLVLFLDSLGIDVRLDHDGRFGLC